MSKAVFVARSFPAKTPTALLMKAARPVAMIPKSQEDQKSVA
jgi:hypothetical protein